MRTGRTASRCARLALACANVAFSIAVAGAAAAAGDAKEPATWPHSRGGPANTGVAKGPLPRTLAKRWVYQTQGPVKSSAVLGHGRAYIGSDDGFVHAIDLATGQRAWAFQAGSAVQAPPLIHGDTLYVGSTGGSFYALTLEGEIRFRAEVDGKITGSAAVVEDGTTGRTLVLVGSHAGILQAFDAGRADGKPVWRHAITDPINGGIGIRAGHAVFGGCDGRLHVVSVADGKPVRSLDAGGIVACSVALDGSDAYFGTFQGEIIRADTTTGEIAWRFRAPDVEYHSSPALTDSVVIVGSQDQRVQALDRATGRPLWEHRTKGRVDGSPVVSGHRVVVGASDGRLYVLDLGTGKLLDAFEVGGRISGSPAVGPKLVVVGTESNEVYAFGDGP